MGTRGQAFAVADLVADVLRHADVVFANCEAALLDKDDDAVATKGMHFCADARSADGLCAAGFNAMSCANNHIRDGGPEALLRGRGLCTARRRPVERTRQDVVKEADNSCDLEGFAKVPANSHFVCLGCKRLSRAGTCGLYLRVPWMFPHWSANRAVSA